MTSGESAVTAETMSGWKKKDTLIVTAPSMAATLVILRASKDGAEDGERISGMPAISLRTCRDGGECCMRQDGKCIALADTKFLDGKCHFRKTRPRGKNLYDLEKRRRR